MTVRIYPFAPKNRRGLSSVVGALLFVVLMVATFAVLGVALNSQTDIVSTGRDVAEIGLEKQQEKFTANIFANSTEYLFVDVNNDGQNPVEIFTLVVTNSTQTEIHEVPSDTSFVAPGFTENVIANTPIKLTLATSGFELYNFKVISSLGTIKTGSILCSTTSCEVLAGTGSLRATLFLDGPNAINTKNTTAVMFVTNTSDEDLTDVQPTKGFAAPFCDDLWMADDSAQTENLVDPEDVVPCNVTPSIAQTLGPHETTLFKWDGEIQGDIGSTFEFCSSVSGDDSGGPVTVPPVSCDITTVIDPNDCGGCGEGGGEGGETIILIDDLLIKPSLFLTIPSPFGSVASAGSADDHLGLWGVQVANPLNFTISVTKVTITAFAPGANSNLKIFDLPLENENVSPNYIATPGDDGSWITDAENTLVWKNFTNPIVLGPYQSETFMYKSNPWTNSVDLEAIIVQTSIFSTAGSFGKAAYQTTMFPAGGANDAPIANVFLSNVVDSADSGDIIGHMNNMVNGTAQEFHAVMADMDKNNQSWLASGSQFIINVPREWSIPIIDNAQTTKIIKNATEPQIIAHSDGSHQIIGLLSEDIGNVNAIETATITFSSTPPEKENDRLFIMYVLGNGETNTPGQTVGPLSEVILHVIGNVTGYP